MIHLMKQTLHLLWSTRGSKHMKADAGSQHFPLLRVWPHCWSCWCAWGFELFNCASFLATWCDNFFKLCPNESNMSGYTKTWQAFCHLANLACSILVCPSGYKLVRPCFLPNFLHVEPQVEKDVNDSTPQNHQQSNKLTWAVLVLTAPLIIYCKRQPLQLEDTTFCRRFCYFVLEYRAKRHWKKYVELFQ